MRRRCLGFLGAMEIFYGRIVWKSGRKGTASLDRDLPSHDARKEMRESLSSGPQTSAEQKQKEDAPERALACWKWVVRCWAELSVGPSERKKGKRPKGEVWGLRAKIAGRALFIVFSFSFLSGGYLVSLILLSDTCPFLPLVSLFLFFEVPALAPFYFLVFFSEHSPSWNNVASGSNQNISSIYFTGKSRKGIMFLAILFQIGVE